MGRGAGAEIQAATKAKRAHRPIDWKHHDAASRIPVLVASELGVDGPSKAVDGVCEMEALDPLGELLANTVDHEDQVTPSLRLGGTGGT